jgi:hypothetical protein
MGGTEKFTRLDYKKNIDLMKEINTQQIMELI